MEYLEFSLDWRTGDFQTFFIISTCLVCFVTYWFTAKSAAIKERFYKKHGEDQGSFRHIFFTKIFGFVSMGLIPLLVCSIVLDNFSAKEFGLTFIPETAYFSLTWIVGLSLLVVPLVYFSAKKPKNLVNYPQIRAKLWNRKMVVMNAVGWFLYLFGYEFLFRGILLFPLLDTIGIWPAIAINIALYSATHIPKGLDETIGAIPLGLVLCLLTIASGTIWIAFLVHVAMAWTNTFTSLKYNPEMKYEKA